LTSSFREKPVGRLAAVGEIGLTGEIRPVPQLDKRITEASRLGFTTCLVPGRSGAVSIKGSSINILRVETLEQAIEIAMSL
jgi:DNA repair protein RadA/Sms